MEGFLKAVLSLALDLECDDSENHTYVEAIIL